MTSTPSVIEPASSNSALGVDDVDDGGEHIRGGLRKDPVAEGEHVATGAVDAAGNVAGAAEGAGGAGQPRPRVEVAREGHVVAEALAGVVDVDPPVDADHVGAGVAHQRQELTGGDPEVDARHTRG